jgi:hypothetical protein
VQIVLYSAAEVVMKATTSFSSLGFLLFVDRITKITAQFVQRICSCDGIRESQLDATVTVY